MRRPSGTWGLVGLSVVACAFAAHAPAAPAPTLFELSVTGTASQQWTYTAAPDVDGDCTRTRTSEGIRSVQFRTAAPVLVRLVGGRVRPADLRGLTGTVTLAGANTIDESCGGVVGTGRIEDCVRTKRSFSGARARISSPRAGLVDVGRVRNVRLRASDCPREPLQVRQRPLGPLLSTLRLPEAVLQERVSRMVVRASATRRTAYALPEAGNLRERAEWSLTFVRAKP